VVNILTHAIASVQSGELRSQGGAEKMPH
jgi:hypothetical protein